MRTIMSTAVLWGLMGSATAFAADAPILSTSGKFEEQTGEALFNQVCQGCHMVKGEGAKGAGFYPALASNPKLAAAAYPASVVMNGLHGMPSFASKLSDEQIADVVNYVRSNFGNQYPDKLSAADVKPFRVTP